MYFILDIIAVLIFVITVARCRSKGFFKSFFGMIKVVASIIISYIFMPSVAYFYRTKIIEKIVTDKVAVRINILSQRTSEGINLEKLFSDMPDEFNDIIDRYGATLDSLAERFGSLTAATEDKVNEMANQITSSVTHTISDILGFATLFIAGMVIFSIAISIIGVVMKLPVISGIDRGLGFLFGVITGLLLVWVYCNLAKSGLELLYAVNPGIVSESVIDNTYIVKYISDNYPFGFAAKMS